VTERRRRLIAQAIRYVLAAVALAFFLLPISWICLTAFKTGDWIYKTPPVWLAPDPTLVHFELFIISGGLKALANSIIITTSATALALLIGSLAAYGLARYRVGGTNLPFFILSQRFMPPVVIVFPFLMIFKMLKWMDTYQALIVIYLTFNLPYAVWMMRGFFLEIPLEVEESALVDGCSPFGVFRRIALPLVAPGLVATGVFCFIFAWAEFFFAVCLTRSKAMPLSVFLVNSFGKGEIMWGQIAATSIVAMVPMFLVSVAVQRYLVRGLTMGAVK
jgi:multiple sugar transport system permease protein